MVFMWERLSLERRKISKQNFNGTLELCEGHIGTAIQSKILATTCTSKDLSFYFQWHQSIVSHLYLLPHVNWSICIPGFLIQLFHIITEYRIFYKFKNPRYFRYSCLSLLIVNSQSYCSLHSLLTGLQLIIL